MIPRKTICEFLRLYPWNSIDLKLDLEQELVEAIAEKVATETIFTDIGLRFYDYLRGRFDATEPVTEENRMPNPGTEPDKVTDWVRAEFDPKDLIQLFLSVNLPEITSNLIIDDLLAPQDDPEVTEETRRASLKLLESDTEFGLKLWEAFTEDPRSDEVIEKYSIKRKTRD